MRNVNKREFCFKKTTR